MLMLLCAFAGSVGALTGCHYSEEEKWSVCCVLYVRADETAAGGARIVLNWYRNADFDGEGRGGRGPYGEGQTFYNSKDDKIRLEIAHFLADSPGGHAATYFIDLGMTCDPPPTMSKGGMTRCQIDLPVRARCGPTYRFLPGTTPIPEELQKPFPALLRVRLELSADTLIEIFSQVDPVSGGRLCHR
jgi:hypothetical protein